MLKEQINTDFMTAFKAKDMEKKNFLGVVKGEIQTEEGRTGTANDEVVLAILKKMEKSLKQTNTEESLRELTYIEGYLPKLMSEDVIREKVKAIISENEGSNMGFLMGMFNKQNAGQAFDNKVVSNIIKEEIA
jgi:uncharacterized protein YqeY